MSNVVVFTPRRCGVGLHHRCPFCGDMDGFVNITAQQCGYCSKHRVKWHLGANLTDDWLQETRRDWVANQHYLDGLALVYPDAPRHRRSGSSMTIDDLRADASAILSNLDSCRSPGAAGVTSQIPTMKTLDCISAPPVRQEIMPSGRRWEVTTLRLVAKSKARYGANGWEGQP